MISDYNFLTFPLEKKDKKNEGGKVINQGRW